MNIQITDFLLCEFILEKRKGIMRINQVFFYSKLFCSSLILSWTHKEVGLFKSKPQVLQASPVPQLVWSAETTAQSRTCRQAVHVLRSVLFQQDLSSWALAQVGSASAMMRAMLKSLGGWGTQVDCFLYVSVEAWKMVGVGGYGQGSGDLRSVYERFRCVWSRSQSCTSC